MQQFGDGSFLGHRKVYFMVLWRCGGNRKEVSSIETPQVSQKKKLADETPHNYHLCENTIS